MIDENHLKTIVCGHRNPDTDSIASAYAYAELKRATGMKNIHAVCAGLPGPRTEFLFKRFGVPMPPTRGDVFPRVRDIMDCACPKVKKGHSLLDAITVLEEKRASRLPVTGDDGKFLGMISMFSLLRDMLHIGTRRGVTGREVRSTLRLINEVLQGEALSMQREDEEQVFQVYVAAMNVESFKEHIPQSNPDQLAIIVGDRTDIHLMSLGIGARLMIITGSREVDEVVLAAARAKGLSIIKTPFDSAAVVRRLKVSCPVELLVESEVQKFRPECRLADIRRELMLSREDIFPVVDQKGNFIASFSKHDIDNIRSNLILVDHNEFDQSIAGVEEVPVIEVIDHHRIGFPPTHTPIRMTCDAVGSTCTLVYEQYRNLNIEIPPATAGILLGGIITDTLMLRSPTTTCRDKAAVEQLEKTAQVSAESLMEEIFKVGSLIARSTPAEALNADRKSFREKEFSFSIAQVEEVGFDEFNHRFNEMLAEAQNILETEKLDLFGLLVTNVVREDSLLLAVGNQTLLDRLPYRSLKEHLYDLPGILSRKKQLLPQILKLVSDFQQE